VLPDSVNAKVNILGPDYMETLRADLSEEARPSPSPHPDTDPIPHPNPSPNPDPKQAEEYAELQRSGGSEAQRQGVAQRMVAVRSPCYLVITPLSW